MLPELSKIKGVHPGAILKRELKIQGLKGNELANSISEHKQTISAILNKRRAINPKLSIKLSIQFHVDADYFMHLQASYDVRKAAELEIQKTPNLSKIRKVLFWDTPMEKINWIKNRTAVIKRVFERGNKMEIMEIMSFYGKDLILEEIKLIKKSHLSTFEKNIKAYNLI